MEEFGHELAKTAKENFGFEVTSLFSEFLSASFSSSFVFELDFMDQIYSQQREILLVLALACLLCAAEQEDFSELFS